MTKIAQKTPYYAVIFSATLQDGAVGYEETAERMEALARTMPGFLGFESARSADGFGISVSYWESKEAIANWKRNEKHRAAQKKGQEEWYANYEIRVARIERAYFKK